jgi:hypothetical protein
VGYTFLAMGSFLGGLVRGIGCKARLCHCRIMEMCWLFAVHLYMTWVFSYGHWWVVGERLGALGFIGYSWGYHRVLEDVIMPVCDIGVARVQRLWLTM